MVLDKTGTLTEGRPSVVDAAWAEGSETARRILFSLEKRSGHPLSQAVVESLGGERDVPVTGFEAFPGRVSRASRRGGPGMPGTTRCCPATASCPTPACNGWPKGGCRRRRPWFGSPTRSGRSPCSPLPMR
ncbi:MAG: HAD family hydrolase [Alistipes shahii]